MRKTVSRLMACTMIFAASTQMSNAVVIVTGSASGGDFNATASKIMGNDKLDAEMQVGDPCVKYQWSWSDAVGVKRVLFNDGMSTSRSVAGTYVFTLQPGEEGSLTLTVVVSADKMDSESGSKTFAIAY